MLDRNNCPLLLATPQSPLFAGRASVNDNGSGPIARPSPVPLVRLRESRLPIEDMAAEIERLRDQAEREGLIQIAYCLELARVEAQRLAEQSRRDEAERNADLAT